MAKHDYPRFVGLLYANTVWLVAFVGLALAGTLIWVRHRDPFDRIWFNFGAPDTTGAKSVVILPKTARGPLPVLIYLQDSGEGLIESGNALRQMAEMGFAAVGIEYNQTNSTVLGEQLVALINNIRHQSWADPSRIAWVGFGLGAQRQLSFALSHPNLNPDLLVRISGGWVPDLGRFEGGSPSEESLHPKFATLIIHAGNDEVFPASEARRVKAALEALNGSVELKVFPREDHDFEPNRALIFRAVAEYCLKHLKGPEALSRYASILDWETSAKPLWIYWTPAYICGLAWICSNRARRTPQAITPTYRTSRHTSLSTLLLWGMVGTFALGAAFLTWVHIFLPYFKINRSSLAIARKYLISSEEIVDFDFLQANSRWRGSRLKILLMHVELANYTRKLVNWNLDDQIYRSFVLSPEIDPALDGDRRWRRTFWETFYPRIRKEDSMTSAAEIVVRFLRERVTIVKGEGIPSAMADTWKHQITNGRGFTATYVAALRSAGIPSRLNSSSQAEFWNGMKWEPAPRPLVFESW